jgi:hypothetical protein
MCLGLIPKTKKNNQKVFAVGDNQLISPQSKCYFFLYNILMDFILTFSYIYIKYKIYKIYMKCTFFFSHMWKIDPKDKHIHKNKRDHIETQR